MSWTAWILASACMLAFYDLAKKESVRNNAVLPVLLCSTCFGCLVFTLGLVAGGRLGCVSAASGTELLLALAKSVIVATSWIFTFCALRTLPITIATPIRASAPAIVVILAFFLYAEVPSWIQALGMLLVFAGYWTFSWAGKHEGVDFLRNRAVWLAVAGACCSAASSLWDKYVFQVRSMSVETVQFYFQAGLIAFYAIAFAVSRIYRRLKGSPSHEFEWRWTIPLVGILLAGADWLYFHGLAIPGVSISVGSLMRRFSVVVTFVLGAFFFHEHNLRRKGIALVLVLGGILLLAR